MTRGGRVWVRRNILALSRAVIRQRPYRLTPRLSPAFFAIAARRAPFGADAVDAVRRVTTPTGHTMSRSARIYDIRLTSVVLQTRKSDRSRKISISPNLSCEGIRLGFARGLADALGTLGGAEDNLSPSHREGRRVVERRLSSPGLVRRICLAPTVRLFASFHWHRATGGLSVSPE